MKKSIIALLMVMSLLALSCGGGSKSADMSKSTDATKTTATTEAPAAQAEKKADDTTKNLEEKVAKSVNVKEVVHDKWEIGKKGGSFTIGLLGDPKSLNLQVASETSTQDVVGPLYASIINRDQFTLDWKAYMAESWTVGSDEKTVIVKLKPGLKWSDGQPLTAKDVVFTANQLTLREDVQTNGRESYFYEVEGSPVNMPAVFELVDDLTYKVTLPVVYAGLLGIASPTPMPMHVFAPVIGWDESMGYDYKFNIVEKEVTEGEGDAAVTVKKMVREEVKPEGVDYAKVNSFWGVDTDVTTLVGCGPWVMTSYVPGQRVTYKPNPYYYEKDEDGVQLPYLDSLNMLILADQDTMSAKFKAGDVDVLGLRGEDVATYSDEADKLGVDIYSIGPAASTNFITFNLNPEAEIASYKTELLNNKKFRKALSHLVDRQTIVNNIAYGFALPQYTCIYRASPYYWAEGEDVGSKFDPATAADILDDLGLVDTDGDGIREDKNGNKIEFDFTTNTGNSVREQIGVLFSNDCASVGIKINFQPEDFNALVTKLLSGKNWDMILIGLTGAVDPISGGNVFPSRGNLHMIEPNQKSPRRDWEKVVDEAWKMANYTTNEYQRKIGYEVLQRVWMDENPWVYTINNLSLTAIKRGLGNVKPQPITGMGVAALTDRLYWK